MDHDRAMRWQTMSICQSAWIYSPLWSPINYRFRGGKGKWTAERIAMMMPARVCRVTLSGHSIRHGLFDLIPLTVCSVDERIIRSQEYHDGKKRNLWPTFDIVPALPSDLLAANLTWLSNVDVRTSWWWWWNAIIHTTRTTAMAARITRVLYDTGHYHKCFPVKVPD